MYANEINKIGDSYLPCIAVAHSPQVMSFEFEERIKRLQKWLFLFRHDVTLNQMKYLLDLDRGRS